MKKICFLLFLGSFSLAAQVGINNIVPRAQLDISASNSSAPANTDGILIPRMSAFPAINPGANQNGMLVFLTQAVGNKSSGFYYWDNASSLWVGVNSNASANSDVLNLEDFLFDEYAGSGSNDNQYSFTRVVANSGFSDIEGATSNNNYIGIHQLGTGTTNNNTGRGAIGSSNWINKFRVGANEYMFEFRVRFPVLAVSAGINYRAFFGLTDLTSADIASSQIANGVYFTYTHSGIVGTCERAGTISNTSAFTPVANQWYKLRFVVNAAGNSVDFFIDGVKLGSSITTNIPLSATSMKIVGLIEKVSTSSTSRIADIDYIIWRMVR